VIIVDVFSQDAAQVIFTDDDQMIETLSANRADYAFDVSRPYCTGRNFSRHVMFCAAFAL